MFDNLTILNVLQKSLRLNKSNIKTTNGNNSKKTCKRMMVIVGSNFKNGNASIKMVQLQKNI